LELGLRHYQHHGTANRLVALHPAKHEMGSPTRYIELLQILRAVAFGTAFGT